jgi:hypothetical protein
MATESQLKAVAEVLADESNASATAMEVAEKVMAALERSRRRDFKYVVIAQDRRRPTGGLRSFHPTWVLGPFYTASEAGSAARAERDRLKPAGHPEVHVMTAQVFETGAEVDPDSLKEVLA